MASEAIQREFGHLHSFLFDIERNSILSISKRGSILEVGKIASTSSYQAETETECKPTISAVSIDQSMQKSHAEGDENYQRSPYDHNQRDFRRKGGVVTVPL